MTIRPQILLKLAKISTTRRRPLRSAVRLAVSRKNLHGRARPD
jgi:hypothetical protein